MEIGNSNIHVNYKDGALLVTALDGNAELKLKAAAAVNPVLDSVVAKFESGEIDLIKGTDIDKDVALKIISLLKAEVNK